MLRIHVSYVGAALLPLAKSDSLHVPYVEAALPSLEKSDKRC